jgi:hypothetical protein
VPDADDTAGALLALAALPPCPASAEAALAGAGWLVDLQNRDGGWPTFCRGWGKLPFDRSGCDLSAHVLRGLLRWRGSGPARLARRIGRAAERGFAFLARTQRADGGWPALWFGTQADQASLAPNLVVSSQVYDWTGIIKDMIAKHKAGTLGGEVFTLRLSNGGLKIAYNAGYKLATEAKAAGDAAIEGIKKGTIKVQP